MSSNKTYSQLKNDLESIINSLQNDNLDIDQAIQRHIEATKLIKEMSYYLKSAEIKINKVVSKS